MSIQKINSLEETILNQWIESKAIVTIYLKNGISLKGLIIEHSSDTISLLKNKIMSKVFKHAITTILPYCPKQFNF